MFTTRVRLNQYNGMWTHPTISYCGVCTCVRDEGGTFRIFERKNLFHVPYPLSPHFLCSSTSVTVLRDTTEPNVNETCITDQDQPPTTSKFQRTRVYLVGTEKKQEGVGD